MTNEADDRCVVGLPKGTLLAVNGVPVELAEDVAALAHPADVPALFGCDKPGLEPRGRDSCDGGDVRAEVAGLRRPLRDRLAQRLVDAAVERGADRAKAEQAVAEVASERPLLDWLFNGGFEKLLDLILKLITLI